MTGEDEQMNLVNTWRETDTYSDAVVQIVLFVTDLNIYDKEAKHQQETKMNNIRQQSSLPEYIEHREREKVCTSTVAFISQESQMTVQLTDHKYLHISSQLS